jgi:hypothetical protein
VGDVIAQLGFGDGAPFDLRRLGVFTFLGLTLIGPALHVWYGTLSRLVTATGSLGALGRMAADQLVFAPFFLSSIIASIMALEGHAAEVPPKLRRDLATIVRSNWALWVPFQFLNFRFVPVHLQVLASNVVALAWNVYMVRVGYLSAQLWASAALGQRSSWLAQLWVVRRTGSSRVEQGPAAEGLARC